MACGRPLHPVSVRRFPSFRTQPLENLSVDSVNNGFLSNPAPGENLLSGNLVMETGCSRFLARGHVLIFQQLVHLIALHQVNALRACRQVCCGMLFTNSSVTAMEFTYRLRLSRACTSGMPEACHAQLSSRIDTDPIHYSHPSHPTSNKRYT